MKSLTFLTVLLFSTLSFAQCLGDLCVGRQAIDQYDRMGVIERIEGGNVYYRTRGGSILEGSSSSLSAEDPSSRYSINSKVIDQYDREGNVEVAFRDGRVSYRTSGGSQLISRTVSPEIQDRGYLRRQGDLIDQYDRVGKVETIYEDGRVSYRTRGGSQLISSSVSPAVPEYNGIEANNGAIDQYDRTGTVTNVFADGRVEYRTSGGSVLISREVSPSVAGLDNGVRPGVIVVDQYDRVGSAENVYRDGRVQYRTTGGSSLISREVSPEVDSHPRFQKNTEYASNSDIGEAIRFFANGKIQLQGDGTSICDELFEEVESLDGIAANTEVVLPSGEGKVENIFANWMSRIIVGDARVNANILTDGGIEERFVRQNWLQAIHYKLNEPNVVFRLNVAIEKKHYRKLLELLKRDLNDRSSPYRGQQKQRINTFLDSELRRITPAPGSL